MAESEVKGMYDTVLSRNRYLYRWELGNKIIADGFTSQKKAMNYLKENNDKGKGYTLRAYYK